MPRPNARDRRTHAKLTAAITEAAASHALPGTLLARYTRCNKPGCRCMTDPPQLHGPYYQWTRKVDGKTKTVLLTPEQVERYKPWFDNAQQLRALTAQLEAHSLHIASTTEKWA